MLGINRATVPVKKALRRETVAGIIIVGAALLGFWLANSPFAEHYFALRETKIGIPQLGINLDLGHWAADGLLAIFFFIVGLELKHEFAHGALSKVSTAIVPVAAAIGGVAVPAIIYIICNPAGSTLHGWAIPTATDIAFAVAVLALIAPNVPTSLRVFLLTLAVVDDLIAIAIIAIFYTAEVHFWALFAAVAPIALYALLARKLSGLLVRRTWALWVILFPIGLVVWALFLVSGLHATIAGVMLAFTIPVKTQEGRVFAEKLAFKLEPISAGVAVPIFAFFSAGVALGGETRFPFDSIVYGVVIGLVVGKPVGIMLTTWAITKFTKATLDPQLKWSQMLAVSSLAGIGFTVSLLISELSFNDIADRETASLAVMTGSLLAVLLSTVLFLTIGKQQKV
ncbi:Na+/H+ antiporter NhaA [Canibacter sp. lx-72]|nr:Na+/H+ antiporter NhaA [Canibacter zhuwentaonis]MBT1035124.1 Na+/H+ antiporter NhaA [Canibacter zhuwentaonis]